MLLVYGDESLDEAQNRACAVGGIVGTEESWKPLVEKWIERTGGISFHAKDCDIDHGDFTPKGNEDIDKKHRENKSLDKGLTITLADGDLLGQGSPMLFY